MQESRRELREELEGHWHVAVFHGRNDQYAPGLVLHAARGGWEVHDELGQLGTADATYGVFPSMAEACREALRLLRTRYGAPTRPCWGAGAPNRALRELGYSRGRAQWRWWPPRLEVTGASRVGPNGSPEPADAPAT